MEKEMSQGPSEIRIKTKKQQIRLWFECLQICLDDETYKENLASSSDFYAEWGNIRGLRFDDWWKEHKYLFEESYVSEVSRVSNNPNTITLSIPVNEKISTILKDVKRIVEQRQNDRLEELGIDSSLLKSKGIGGGKYKFAQKEIKGKFHYINLEVYKIFLKLNKPPINREFLINVRKEFEGRHRSKLSKNIIWIPQLSDFETTYRTNGDVEDIIRTVRRGIKGVEKTLLNVSNGRFP